jgi:hypothetical protein
MSAARTIVGLVYGRYIMPEMKRSDWAVIAEARARIAGGPESIP